MRQLALLPVTRKDFGWHLAIAFSTGFFQTAPHDFLNYAKSMDW